MDLYSHLQSVDSSDESKISGFASDSDMKLALDISTPVVHSESRYLTRLMVYGNEDEFSRSESSQSTNTNVFDSDTRSRTCAGVIELLTASKYSSFAYEVQQVERALKKTNLTTAQAFDSPNIYVHYEQRKNELQRILSILKDVCETHQLPLAQTWAVSPLSSFASHEESLKMTCNSFDIRCLGKTCMSTASLPFYVPDLGLWSFRKACREQHLDKACSLVGRALLSCGSCFCENVTKLGEEEYPLVHNAQMSGLASCFAIFLHSIESNDDYVLEFFLSLNRDDGKNVHNLVQTLKENIEIAYGFELGDTSSIQVVGPPTEASLFLYTDPQRTINSCITTTKTNILETVSSDSESFVGNVAKTNSTDFVNQLPSKQELFNNNGATITSTEILSLDDVERDNVNVACTKDNGNVMYDHDVSMHMTNVGEKSNSSKQGSKRKLYSFTVEAAEQHVGKPTDEAAKSLGGKSSYLQRTSIEHFSLSSAVFLLLRIKRWSCLIKHHEFSGKWWLCGKHSYLPFKLDSVYQVAQVLLSLKRWRNRKSSMHAIHNRDHPTVFESIENPEYKPNIIKPYCYVDWKLAESSLVYASPKHIVASVISDAKKVTVKATYKDDMIKFQFPTSLGLFELENEVAQRINLKSKRIFLKYRDEDDDLILLACDADLRSLLGSSTSNNRVIKLIIVLVDE